MYVTYIGRLLPNVNLKKGRFNKITARAAQNSFNPFAVDSLSFTPAKVFNLHPNSSEEKRKDITGSTCNSTDLPNVKSNSVENTFFNQ